MAGESIRKSDGEKVRNARPSEWEAVIAAVRCQLSGAQSDLHNYRAKVAKGKRKPDKDQERILRKAVTDRKTTIRILEASFNR